MATAREHCWAAAAYSVGLVFLVVAGIFSLCGQQEAAALTLFVFGAAVLVFGIFMIVGLLVQACCCSRSNPENYYQELH